MTKTFKKRILSLLLSITIAIPAWMPGSIMIANADTVNLLANGSFEGTRNTPTAPDTPVQWPEGQPDHWSYSGSTDTATPIRDALIGTYDDTIFKEGTVSLKLELNGAARYLENRLNPIQPNTKYKFSFWCKTEDLTSTAANANGFMIRAERANVNGIGATASTRTDIIIPVGTNDWTYYERTFTSHSDAATFNAVVQIANHVNPGNKTSGTVWIDDMRLEPVLTEITGIAINSPATTLNINTSLQLSTTITPPDADNQNITWSTSDADIATVDAAGLVTGIAEGTVAITATSDANQAINDTVTLDVVVPPPATGITLDNNTLNLNTNEGKKLIATLNPQSSADAITWSSSDESIAVVNDGLVIGKQAGIVTITAMVNGYTADCTVTVQTAVIDDFDKLRLKWRESIIPYNYDLSVPDTQAKITEIATKAQYYWENMNRTAFTTANVLLWTKPDLTVNGTPQQQEFTDFHKYLHTMSIAFVADGSPLQYNPALLDDIIRGMDWMNANLFTGHGGTPAPKWNVANWWHRDIGMPLNSADIVTLIYDFIPAAKRTEYTDRIAIYASNPQINATGGGNTINANRVDKCKATMVLGILQKDVAKLSLAANTLFTGIPNANVMGPAVTSGNGFYADGSFIEHNIYPYTTSYGTVSISGIARIMYMLADANIDNTSFQFDSTTMNRMYDYIDHSYIPVLYQGLAMDITSGRAISRFYNDDLARGAEVVHAIILIAESAPSPYRETYLGYAKGWIQKNPALQNSKNLWMDQKCRDIVADNSIATITTPNGIHPFNRMARTVYKQDKFDFAIAMHNYRIGTYESINGENPLAYHTADGMTYLYNDLNQFNGNYWATIDYKRLPGTTVDTIDINTIKGNDVSANSAVRWAGAAKIDDYGAAGMRLDLNTRSGMDLTANKSWFLLGGKIIALGSGINSSTGRAVETTIENRKLAADGSNKLSVNGSEITGNHAGTLTADWAHIQGSNNTTSIGYYFPGSQTLSAGKVASTGNWNNVNTAVNDIGDVTDIYAQLIIDHGINPTNGTYHYVVLPGFSEQETKEYSNNPDFEILSHTDTLHAVYDKNLKIIAINNYSAAPQTVTTPIGDVTVSTTASVLIREYADNTVKVAVMEPTVDTTAHLSTVTVDIDRSLKQVVTHDSNVTSSALNNPVTLTYTVNNGITSNAAANYQKTFEAVIELIPLPVHEITENYVDQNGNIIAVQSKTQIIQNRKYVKAAPSITGWIFDHFELDQVAQSGSTATIECVNTAHTIKFVYKAQPSSNSSSGSSLAPTVITLDKSSVTLWNGKKITLTATITGTDQKAQFTSDNTAVATVDENGVILGKSAGTATITALVNGSKTTCTVTVRQYVTKISLSNSTLKLAVGKTNRLKAVVSPKNAYDKSVFYTSSNSKIATVDKQTGLIRAKKPGTVTITAKAKDGSGTTKKLAVTVYRPVAKIHTSKTAIALVKGKSYPIRITVAPANATNRTVEYTSSNKRIATVSPKGYILAKGVGTCYITIKAKDGSNTTTRIKVTVSNSKRYIKTK